MNTSQAIHNMGAAWAFVQYQQAQHPLQLQQQQVMNNNQQQEDEEFDFGGGFSDDIEDIALNTTNSAFDATSFDENTTIGHGSHILLHEAITVLLTFVINFNITSTQIIGLLDLLKFFVPFSVLPRNLYEFDKLFEKFFTK